MSYQLDAVVIPSTDAILKVSVGTTSTAAQALPGQIGQLLLVSANTDTYARFGASGVGAASATTYTIFIPAGSMFLMRKKTTHVRAIRDSADGVLSFTTLSET